ncbi:hypothetical protein DB329_04195, partial [Limosilactobacillus fermentum]
RISSFPLKEMTKPWRNITTIWSDKKNCVFVFISVNLTGDSTETLITVSVDITNIGDRAGKEVVQLYIHRPELDRLQPLKELRQFEKVLLQPGETKTVSFTLSNEELASYDVYNHAWNPISGDYQVMIGSSSQDIQYSADLHYTNHHLLPKHYDLNTTFKELLADEKAHDWILGLMKDLNRSMGNDQNGDTQAASEAINDKMVEAMLGDMPLRQLVVSGDITEEGLIQQLTNFK